MDELEKPDKSISGKEVDTTDTAHEGDFSLSNDLDPIANGPVVENQTNATDAADESSSADEGHENPRTIESQTMTQFLQMDKVPDVFQTMTQFLQMDKAQFPDGES